MILPKGSILKVATTALPAAKTAFSEHNRSEVSVSYERIEKSSRMANARRRKWFIANKRTWSMSWDMLPHSSTYTVDGAMGGEQMETWHDSTNGDFWLYVREPDGSEEQVLVTIESFSKSVQKRGLYEFWNISLSLEEV
jgi:hypothetical protein